MRCFILLLFILIAATGCKKGDTGSSGSESYLPMEVGNCWRLNKENYTEITGTKMIDGELFYEFSSRVGGDVFGQTYLRIDKDNNLIEKYPKYPGEHYTHAKFSDNVGETFWTSGKKDVNDHLAKVIQKNSNQIVFEYTFEYHINLKGTKYTKTYQKGIGYTGYKEVRIGGKVYNF